MKVIELWTLINFLFILILSFLFLILSVLFELIKYRKFKVFEINEHLNFDKNNAQALDCRFYSIKVKNKEKIMSFNEHKFFLAN